MKIGIPREIKNNESRVAISPAGVNSLVENGHEVIIEVNAGKTAGFTDEDYQLSGATLLEDAEQIWDAEMINAGSLGHVNAESNLGDWLYGQALLQRLVQQVNVSKPKMLF